MSFPQRLKSTLLNVAYSINEDASVKYFATRSFKRRFGREPSPSSIRAGFSDKIYRRKIFSRDTTLPLMADKVRCKAVIQSRIGAGYVIPTIWSGNDLSALSKKMEAIPKPFVVKANHGSGWNIFVRNDDEFKPDEIIAKCASWLSQRYGRTAGEWLYSKIQPQILIEPFIAELSTLPIDYKVFVFSGQAHFVQVDTERETNHKRCFYNRSWEKQPFGLEFPIEEKNIPVPTSLSAMIALSEALAQDYSFARVDWYEIDGAPLFGEITFYPGSGQESFFPQAWDVELGKLWQEPC